MKLSMNSKDLTPDITPMLDEAFNEGVDQAIERISMRKDVYSREDDLTPVEKLMFNACFDSVIKDLQQLKKENQ